MLSVKQGGIKYLFFLVFGMTRPGIEPRTPGPLTNILATGPFMSYNVSLSLLLFFESFFIPALADGFSQESEW